MNEIDKRLAQAGEWGHSLRVFGRRDRADDAADHDTTDQTAADDDATPNSHPDDLPPNDRYQ